MILITEIEACDNESISSTQSQIAQHFCARRFDLGMNELEQLIVYALPSRVS